MPPRSTLAEALPLKPELPLKALLPEGLAEREAVRESELEGEGDPVTEEEELPVEVPELLPPEGDALPATVPEALKVKEADPEPPSCEEEALLQGEAEAAPVLLTLPVTLAAALRLAAPGPLLDPRLLGEESAEMEARAVI